MSEYKTCTKCGRSLEVTKNFYKKGKNSNEYRNYCKQCGNSWQLNYYKNNRDDRVRYQKQYEAKKRKTKQRYTLEREDKVEIEKIINNKKYYEGSKIKTTMITNKTVRNKSLAKDYKEYLRGQQNGKIWCEICKQWEQVEEMLEVHHKVKISDYKKEGKDYTTFEDVILLCPNCHKLIHIFENIEDVEKNYSN